GILSGNSLHLQSDKAIPDAQCYGNHTFFYSLIGHKRDWFSAGIHRYAYEHNVPMKAIYGVFPNENKGQKLPPSMSFVSVEPSNLMVSALKRSEFGNGLIIRLYNITDRTVDGIIRTYKNVKSAKLTNLNEEELPYGDIKINDDGSIRLQVDSYEIKTIELFF
ncbi:MAG: glycosyl hydrolase-related protein, partial [Candidatus Poribacteria bacterium]